MSRSSDVSQQHTSLHIVPPVLHLLTPYLTVLVYVIPKTKLRARLAQLFGSRSPTLQHMLANASVRW